MVATPLVNLVFVVILLLLSPLAAAGSLSFRLSLTGEQLTLINQGDSSAFYPAVFRMLSDGSWRALAAMGAPAELAAGAQMSFIWPEMSLPGNTTEFDHMRPVMVQFFDQAGVGFGQISFLRGPPRAKTELKAQYANGRLQIEAPESASPIRATWVLWPQEEGIRPIRLPVNFEHHPPPAQRIDWGSQGAVPFQLATGAGRPAVILIHETGHGYTLQTVAGGGLQGREQRASWLDASLEFYQAAWIALAIAVSVMLSKILLRFLRRRGRRASA